MNTCEWKIGSDDENDCIEEDSLLHLKCFICDFYMVPPIYQCHLGHNYCYHCYNLLRHCPKCASPNIKRNLGLEQLYYKANLPCKYSNNGCPFTARPKELANHEVVCTYTIRKCPFKFTCMCSWTGVIYDLQHHCADVHRYSYSLLPVNKKFFLNLDLCVGGYKVFMIFALDSVFRLVCFVDKRLGWLKFAVNYLGDQLDKDKYSYEMRFLKQDYDKTAIALKTECVFQPDHTKPFVNDNYMILPLNVLKVFCDHSGDLHYVLTITENSQHAQVSGS